MRKALGGAALSCALSLVDAKALKWSNNGPRWVPPQETLLGYMPSLGMESPTPTPPPGPSRVRGVLEARNANDNTCGYMDGSFSGSGPQVRNVYTLTLHSIVAVVRHNRPLYPRLPELPLRVL
jgi:hypothetical protein